VSENSANREVSVSGLYTGERKTFSTATPTELIVKKGKLLGGCKKDFGRNAEKRKRGKRNSIGSTGLGKE